MIQGNTSIPRKFQYGRTKDSTKLTEVLSPSSWQIIFHFISKLRNAIGMVGGAGEFPWWTHETLIAMTCCSMSRSPNCRARSQLGLAWIVPTVVLVRMLWGVSLVTFQRKKLRLMVMWWHFHTILLEVGRITDVLEREHVLTEKADHPGTFGIWKKLHVWNWTWWGRCFHWGNLEPQYLPRSSALVPWEPVIWRNHISLAWIQLHLGWDQYRHPSAAPPWNIKSTEVWISAQTLSPSRTCAREGWGEPILNRILSTGVKSISQVCRMGLLIPLLFSRHFI